MHKLVLAFDMDNTLVKTDEKVFELAIKFCKENKLKKNEVELITCRKAKGNYDKLNEGTRAIIYDEVISKRTYMDLADGSKLVDDAFGDHLRSIKFLFPEVKVTICTHRGDNGEARMSTFNWLDKKNLIEYFDMIYSISHINNSDKIEFLKSRNEGLMVLLIDDNPFGSSSKIREKCGDVLVYDEVVQLPCHKNQDRFVNMMELKKQIAVLLDKV